MDTWTRVIGVILALYAAYAIYSGKVAAGDENSTSYIKRSEKPVQFWISVAFMLLVAATLIFNIFHF